MQGQIVVISGPSGVGKGTLIKKLLKDNKYIELSVSSTTRKPRPGEKHGVAYYFLSEEEFDSKIDNDEFIEWANVHTKRYGTEAQYVSQKVKAGKIVILEIDVQGARTVRDKVEDGLFIFITPPSIEELESRLRGRKTESEEQIQSRMNIALNELKDKDSFDHIVINDDLDKAANQLKNIIFSKGRN